MQKYLLTLSFYSVKMQEPYNALFIATAPISLNSTVAYYVKYLVAVARGGRKKNQAALGFSSWVPHW